MNSNGSEVRRWEFDSHLDITARGKARRMQVWGRDSAQFANTKEWAITEDIGTENPPKAGVGYWTSTDSFKKAFPHFNRNDVSERAL
jgi:hypothetical protein